MEAFARAAVAQGFTHYGFTPHSPIPIDSPCNMLASNINRYFDEVERIRSTYGDRCHFYGGMEIDFLDGLWGSAHPFFHTLPLDYTIGSVHFIRSQDGEFVDTDGRFDTFRRKMERNFHNDIRYVVKTFFQTTHHMIDAGGFDIIGHYDKISLNASYFQPGIDTEPWFKALADDLTDHIIACRGQIAVEINTKHYAEHHRFFPDPRLLAPLKAAGIPILVNSDAHVPALINASRPQAISLLSSI